MSLNTDSLDYETLYKDGDHPVGTSSNDEGQSQLEPHPQHGQETMTTHTLAVASGASDDPIFIISDDDIPIDTKPSFDVDLNVLLSTLEEVCYFSAMHIVIPSTAYVDRLGKSFFAETSGML